MAGLTPQHPAAHRHHGAPAVARAARSSFADGAEFRIPFELMRVYSPSAEVQGHGPGQEVLQTGKREVELTRWSRWATTRCSRRFSDGHDTGIFSWDYLYFLGSQQAELVAALRGTLAGRRRRARRADGAAVAGSACGHATDSRATP